MGCAHVGLQIMLLNKKNAERITQSFTHKLTHSTRHDSESGLIALANQCIAGFPENNYWHHS